MEPAAVEIVRPGPLRPFFHRPGLHRPGLHRPNVGPHVRKPAWPQRPCRPANSADPGASWDGPDRRPSRPASGAWVWGPSGTGISWDEPCPLARRRPARMPLAKRVWPSHRHEPPRDPSGAPRPTTVRPVGQPQIRASQIRASQIRASQIRASQIRASQIRASRPVWIRFDWARPAAPIPGRFPKPRAGRFPEPRAGPFRRPRAGPFRRPRAGRLRESPAGRLPERYRHPGRDRRARNCQRPGRRAVERRWSQAVRTPWVAIEEVGIAGCRRRSYRYTGLDK